MRNHLLALISLFILSVVAVVVLQPDPLTRFEADLSHLPPEEALETLNAPGAYEPQHRNIVLLHAELLRANGEFDRAEALLDQLQKDLPQNSGVSSKLSEVALLVGDRQAAIRHGSANYAASAKPQDRERLGLLHRLNRDVASEIAVLRSVPPEQLTAWEADRLARLLVAIRDVAGAEALYLQLANERGPFRNEARKRAVVVLIDDGRSNDALRHAAQWYAEERYDFGVVSELLPVFVARGAIAEARWLADHAMAQSPETGHQLVSIFSRSGHRSIARQLQDAVLAQTDGISRGEWATLTQFAALTGDVSGLQTAIAASPIDDIPEAMLSDALLQMLRYQGTRALIPYRRLATEELSREAPLIAAAFAVDQARHSATVQYLIEAADTDLNAWDQAIWIAMAERLRGTGYDRQLASSAIASPDLALAARVIVTGSSP